MSDENIIDLDAPEFQESVNYDPTQDQDSRPTPPEFGPDGQRMDYVFKLFIKDNPKGEKAAYGKESEKGTKYIALNVGMQIIAEGQPYHKALVNFPFGGVSSMLFNGTTSMANLARLLGQPMPKGLSQVDQAAYVTSLLQAEPLVPGQIKWGTWCGNCKKEPSKLSGENNWPVKVDDLGQVVGHLNVSECPECNLEVTAQPKLLKLIAVK
jgi:thiol-disulfide isomerase/thioredoxin